MDQVELLPDQRAVRFRQPGLVLNPGSVGKGWALDAAAARIRSQTATALIHGGHSSLLAWGSPPGQTRGWCVGLSDPEQPTRRLGTIWLKDVAMATSAATFRHGLACGRRFGHILDPRSGYPATTLRAATAFAHSAAWADALATAFFVLGEAGTIEVCRRQPTWGAILLSASDLRPKLIGLAKRIQIEWQV
jgi:thiamine biosynthesis lipoprotein